MLMPSTTAHAKRIVFMAASGMAVICGEHSGELPVTLGPFTLLGTEVPFASLVRVTTRAAYYKAPVSPSEANHTFHENQK
jgi:hypothetical protein